MCNCVSPCPHFSAQFMHLKCALQPTNTKITEPFIFKVQGCSKSLMLVSPESSSAELVMMSTGDWRSQKCQLAALSLFPFFCSFSFFSAPL